MAMSVSSATVRAALAASMVTAWDAQQVRFSAALVPLSDDDFEGIGDSETAVRAFALLDTVEPQPNSFSRNVTVFPFKLIGQFKFPDPESGDVLQDVKEANADALIALLTATARYAGGGRRITSVRYNDIAATEQTRAYFEVEVGFEWKDSTGQ